MARNLLGIAATSLLVLTASQAPTAAQIDATGHYTVAVGGSLSMPYGTCTADVEQIGTDIEFAFDCLGGNFFDGAGTIDPVSGEISGITGTCSTGLPGDPTVAPWVASGTADGSTFVVDSLCQGIESPLLGSKCGNGLLDSGEDCDDGNFDDGDCCSGTCAAETGNVCSAASPQCTVATCDSSGTCVPGAAAAPAGTQCDTDADLCTTAEVCDGSGGCQPTGGPLDCGLCASCDAAQGCVADWPEIDDHPEVHAEPGECRGAGKDKAKLINRLDGDDRDSLLWSWKKSNGFPVSDFGTPTGTAAYTLCLYGQGTMSDRVVLGEMAIPAGSGWSAAPGGYRYKDELPDGTKVKIDLRASAQDGKPKLKVKIKGGGLGYPEVLDDAVHASVQGGAIKLTADNGKCWASSLGVTRTSGIKGGNEKLNLKNCYPNWSKCR
jgi:cysteine-rich repeat protein